MIAVGTPEEVAGAEGSHTGRFLRPVLFGGDRVEERTPALELV